MMAGHAPARDAKVSSRQVDWQAPVQQPSGLVTAPAGIRHVFQVGRTERLRKQTAHRLDTLWGVHLQVWATVFPEKLPAASAGHQRLPEGVDAGEGEQSPAPAGDQVRHQPAFGAESDTIGGVLDVAPDHDPAVIDQTRRAYREVRVGRVGMFTDRPSSGTQVSPVDVHLVHPALHFV